MKYIILIGIIVLSGCETFTNKYGPEINSTRAVYSEAGGISSWLTGKVSSCMVMDSKDGKVVVKELTFDEDTCSVKLVMPEGSE